MLEKIAARYGWELEFFVTGIMIFKKATLPCIWLRYYLIIHCCYIYFWQAYDYIRTKKERSPELSNLPKARYILFAPFLCNATIKVFLVMTNMIHCLNPISVTKRRQGSLIKRPETSLLSGNLGHVNICDNICFFKLWYHTFFVRRTLHSLTQYDLMY